MTTMKTKMLQPSIFLVLSIIAGVFCSITETCTPEDVWQSHLDIAIDFISMAKREAYNKCPGNCGLKSVDCADILHMGHHKNGVYEIWPMNRITDNKPLSVFCDMKTDGGGWTVIQRRGDFQRPKEYFFKDWKAYKEGFGDKEKDFWLGNDNIFALTNQKLYSVRFDMKDVENARSFAVYDKFWIDDENNKYTLHIYDYSGDAGDSMTSVHNNKKFSTYDQDNDNYEDGNCGQEYKSGWWFHTCHQANLNGVYYKGDTKGNRNGVDWTTWKGYFESLEWTEIKIRPKNV